MEPDALAPSLSYTEFVYNNESEVAPLYWPLSMSQMITKRNAYELYTDNADQYITYSGSWQSLLVAREKEGRYRSFTLRAYSGDSFKFYISTPSGVTNSRYYAGPLTSSGVYNTLQEYASENDARTNAVTFTAPSGNSYVYSLPQVLPIDWVRLHHQSVVSGESYRLYQFLPRTLIQVDDLEAEVIDAVTLRVSDSIVVTADDLADGSITGAKILAGTVSGVLITPGTITSNLIQANSITADRLNVTQLDTLAANTGSLFVNSGITLGENGFLWTGQSASGEVLFTKEGLLIDNAFAVGMEVSRPGGGGFFAFNYVPRSRIRYLPSLYSGTSPLNFNYTLSPYSGSEVYFDLSASQVGKQGFTSSTFNGYASKIQTGYTPTSSGLRNDYVNSEISVIASGQSYLTLQSTDTKETMQSTIALTAGGNGSTYIGGSPGTRVTIDSRELRIRTNYVNIKDTLTVYKDISQESPFIEEFSPILEVNETSFKYINPKDSSGPSTPAVDLFVVDSSGNASVKDTLTVSGTITSVGSGIFLKDVVDNSTIFEASSTGLFVRSTTGDRIIDVSTSTGNLDLLGGDFFVYNAAENTIVAGITKTGASEFRGITNTGSISTTVSVIANTSIQVEDSNNYARVQASQSTLSTRSSANALTFTVDTATGDTRIYRDARIDGNFTQFNYGSMTKNAAQTVNAGVTAKITFQVAGNNGALDDLTNNQINIVDAGLYLIVAGVVSTTVGLPWQVVTGGAYNSGVLLNGVTQADGRAYSSKMLYLNPGELELWLSNTGGTNAAISTGNNGAVLSATKVG